MGYKIEFHHENPSKPELIDAFSRAQDTTVFFHGKESNEGDWFGDEILPRYEVQISGLKYAIVGVDNHFGFEGFIRLNGKRYPVIGYYTTKGKTGDMELNEDP